MFKMIVYLLIDFYQNLKDHLVEVEEEEEAVESSRKVLGSLAGITQGLAELRNLYGTGHGRARTSGILPRHAMLMVGASATIARFMMATYEDRKKAEAATT